jgi:hypothetical protein
MNYRNFEYNEVLVYNSWVRMFFRKDGKSFALIYIRRRKKKCPSSFFK